MKVYVYSDPCWGIPIDITLSPRGEAPATILQVQVLDIPREYVQVVAHYVIMQLGEGEGNEEARGFVLARYKEIMDAIMAASREEDLQ